MHKESKNLNEYAIRDNCDSIGYEQGEFLKQDPVNFIFLDFMSLSQDYNPSEEERQHFHKVQLAFKYYRCAHNGLSK